MRYGIIHLYFSNKNLIFIPLKTRRLSTWSSLKAFLDFIIYIYYFIILRF